MTHFEPSPTPRVGQIVSRRVSIGEFVAVLMSVSRLARAQPAAKPARIGWLGRSAGKETLAFSAFAEGLHDLVFYFATLPAIQQAA